MARKISIGDGMALSRAAIVPRVGLPAAPKGRTAVKAHPKLASSGPTPLESTIAEIRGYHRERCYAMAQRKRADLALLAFLRTQLGWSKDLPEADRNAIKLRAKAIADGKEDPGASRWMVVVEASHLARKPFDDIEGAAVKAMAKLARTLPAWEEFGESIRGFGEVSLAVIVAEAGDLSKGTVMVNGQLQANYATPGKLWKRMGVAVMDGIRQGGLKKTSAKEDWIAHGYNPMRRSHMWNIGDALIKAQVRKVKDSSGEDTGERTAIGDYGQIYLDRKAYELARDPDMTPMHAHRRAQRFMEKRVLKNLWQAWRREPAVQTIGATQSSVDRAAAIPELQQAKRRAIPSADVPAVGHRAKWIATPKFPPPGATPSKNRQAVSPAKPTPPAPASTNSQTKVQATEPIRFPSGSRSPQQPIQWSKPRRNSAAAGRQTNRRAPSPENEPSDAPPSARLSASELDALAAKLNKLAISTVKPIRTSPAKRRAKDVSQPKSPVSGAPSLQPTITDTTVPDTDLSAGRRTKREAMPKQGVSGANSHLR